MAANGAIDSPLQWLPMAPLLHHWFTIAMAR